MNGDSYHYVEADFLPHAVRKINTKDNLEDKVIGIEREFMDKIDKMEESNVSVEVTILESLGYTK